MREERLFDAVFVSDIHLSTDVPARTHAFVSFLRRVRTRKLYILGDMFDYWVGDDHLRLFRRNGLVEALGKTASSGTQIYLMPGNRDFMLNRRTAKKLHATLLPERHVLTLPAGKTILMHGDQLLLNDIDYMLFRAVSRCCFLKLLFKALPFSLRMGTAQIVRHQSRSAVQRKHKYHARTLTFSRIALRSLLEQGFAQAICGHLHRTRVIRFRLGDSVLTVYVLGQWTQEGGDYLALNSGKLSFRRFRI